MAFVPFENAAELRIRMSLDGEPVETGFGLLATTGGSISALQSCVNFVGPFWANNIMPLLSTVTVLREVTAWDLSAPISFTRTWQDPVLTNGQYTGQPEPNQVSAPFALLTGIRGRSYRGRMSIPGLTGNSCQTNIIQSEWLAAMLAAFSDLLSQMGGASAYVMAVLSRVSEGVERTEGVASAVNEIVYRRVGPGTQDTRSKG